MICDMCNEDKDADCFYTYPNGYTMKICRTCKNKREILRKERAKEKKTTKKPRKLDELDRLSIEADRLGISYGKYVAMKERGMRIEGISNGILGEHKQDTVETDSKRY